MHPRHAISLVLLLAGLAFAQDVSSEPLVTQLIDPTNPSLGSTACVQLRAQLADSPHQSADELRARLCQELGQTTNPVIMRRLARTLAASPCEEALQIGLARLEPSLPIEVRVAGCEVVGRMAAAYGPGDPRRGEAIKRLGAVLQEDEVPSPLTNSVLLGLAEFGPQGFEALLRVRKTSPRATQDSDILYSALARTGDLRALPFLRDALSDGRAREAMRIQAVHAMGQLAAMAASRAEPIEPRERDACVRLLVGLAAGTDSDQMFSVAIQSLSHMTDAQRTPALHGLIVAGLYSPSSTRQDAGLMALYASDCGLLDVNLVPVVQQIAENGEETCRATAQAVLDKCDLQPPATGQ